MPDPKKAVATLKKGQKPKKKPVALTYQEALKDALETADFTGQPLVLEGAPAVRQPTSFTRDRQMQTFHRDVPMLQQEETLKAFLERKKANAALDLAKRKSMKQYQYQGQHGFDQEGNPKGFDPKMAQQAPASTDRIMAGEKEDPLAVRPEEVETYQRLKAQANPYDRMQEEARLRLAAEALKRQQSGPQKQAYDWEAVRRQIEADRQAEKELQEKLRGPGMFARGPGKPYKKI